MTSVSAPEPLTDIHDCTSFDSGSVELDDWLRTRALANQETGAIRTYVICTENAVIGYYSLAAGAIARGNAPRRIRQNMPDPIPMMVLARLAVDKHVQRQGLGKALLGDVARRTLGAATEFGMVGLLVQAISDDARTYYLNLGFLEFRTDPLIMCLPLASIRTALIG